MWHWGSLGIFGTGRSDGRIDRLEIQVARIEERLRQNEVRVGEHLGRLTQRMDEDALRIKEGTAALDAQNAAHRAQKKYIITTSIAVVAILISAVGVISALIERSAG